MQTFDVTKPISGITKFSQLYQIIRDHDQANQSHFSGATAPTSPVIGQLWEDSTNDKLFLYTAASGWSEVAVANIGLGLELIAARGTHASLDSRMDAQLNEDGTLKAATTLNPSQWYDLSVASGWISTTSFRALGANYTTVYYPTRRVKINQTGGAYYTEVVSSSYSAPNTTVVVRDAVCGASAAVFRDVSHSIVSPRKASAGDGAVSFEMVANMGYTTVGDAVHTQLIGDSVIFMAPTTARTLTLMDCATFGAARPLFICNYGAGTLTVARSGSNLIYPGGVTSLTLLAGRTAILFSYGANWHRLDQPATEVWIDVSSFGSGWTAVTTVSYMKDPFGFVHLRGLVRSSAYNTNKIFTLPVGYRPQYTSLFLGLHIYEDKHVMNFYIDDAGQIDGSNSVNSKTNDVYLDGITFKAA